LTAARRVGRGEGP